MDGRTGIEIDTERLREWLDEGRAVDVIDIRPNADYQAWHIPGSHNVDAYHAIYANSPGALADYVAPQDTPVVLVCFAGQTSKIATHYLRARGIPAMSLSGGMQGWNQAWNTAEVPLANSKAHLIQIRRTGKGCLSYLIGSESEALVIDPSISPQVYQDLAKKNGWQITKVLDTHIHADHLSRSRALAQATGATYYLPRQERVSFEYQKLEGGDGIEVSNARLRAFPTPGHTFESMSFILDDQALFTGDTLFLDSIGRPDLMADPAEAEVRARLLYKSLMGYLTLDPKMLVLPCHTSQPVPFDRSPVAGTLETVSRNIKALSFDEESFATWILGRIPPTPLNYEQIVLLNETGELPRTDPVEIEAGANNCAI